MSSVGILLIAAGVGYWVLTLAAKQKKQIQKLGQLLALIIIVVSLVGAGCKMYYKFACGPGYSKCGYSAGKWGKWGKGGGASCPFSKSATPTASK